MTKKDPNLKVVPLTEPAKNSKHILESVIKQIDDGKIPENCPIVVCAMPGDYIEDMQITSIGEGCRTIVETIGFLELAKEHLVSFYLKDWHEEE